MYTPFCFCLKKSLLYVPLKAWTQKHLSLLFSKLCKIEVKNTICLIAGEKHVADILTDGKKLDSYSMVCSYGKMEKKYGYHSQTITRLLIINISIILYKYE